MPNHWKPYAAKTRRLEEQFEPKLIRVIKNFRKDFINNLQTQGKEYALNQLNGAVWDDELVLLVQNVYKTAGLLGAKMLNDEQKKEQKA